MSDLLFHIVFTKQTPLLAISGRPWDHIFVYTAFWTLCFFSFLATFEDSGAKKVSKMDEYSEGKMPLKSTLSPKSSQGAPREAQELQNEAKVLPKGVKMEPQGPQN